MRNKAFILLLSFILSLQYAGAQTVKVYKLSGSVIEDVSLAALPYAGIAFKKAPIQTTANDVGQFTLVFTDKELKDSVLFTYVGFQSKTVAASALAAYAGTDNYPIKLKASTVQLPEITVTPEFSAQEVLQFCILNRDMNYNIDLFSQHGLYRQLHRENGVYCRLLEADVDIAFKNLTARLLIESAELFKVNQLRRSDVTERNGYMHGDHISDLFKENFIRYGGHSVFNTDNLQYYNVGFDSSSSETDSFYFLRIKSKTLTNQKHQRIYLKVEKGSFAIAAIDMYETPSNYYNKGKAAGDFSDWDFQNGNLHIRFKKHSDNRWYVSSMEQYYNHYVLNTISKNVDYVVEEWFSFFADENDATATVTRDPSYKNFGDLYLKDYNYDATFWQTNETLKAHPLPKDATADLQKLKTLDLQFAANE